MRKRPIWALITILIIAIVAAVIALPISHPEWMTNIAFWQPASTRDLDTKLGLDLRGGVQVLLAADVVAGEEVSRDAMEGAKRVIESRVNGLGVSEALIQLQGTNRIVVELPGIANTDQAVETIQGTGLLEFVDTGNLSIPEGTVVRTTFGATNTVTSTVPLTETVYNTVLTGRDLQTAQVVFDPQTNAPMISFTLTEEGGAKFAEHTRNNVGRFLSITMDKTIISSPRINSAITGGQGEITGQFTLDEAKNLAIQMQYGALPVALKVAESRAVGPTLGQDSIRQSLIAGIIGMLVVIIYMLLYYRLPGVVADVALLIYTAIVLALFKLIPVTLTLPGIAGFVLSIGMAVDANVLIFERTKEELRHGKPLHAAVDAGFSRAWYSIRDSNVSTLITCAILFWFGSTFGATIVKGFALTLAIGVLVSLFTAIVVTRTFLHFVMDTKLAQNHWWFGV